MQDVNILTAMVNRTQLQTSGSGSLAWIGLHRGVATWKWSLLNLTFYKKGEAEFRNWRTGEPNNCGGSEDCGMMLSDGMWNDESCAVLQLPICINVNSSNEIFILMNKLMNWNEAQKYCRERYTDLVSVRNSEENQKVKDLIPDRRGAWIGLFKDDWKWLDGSNSTFRNWEKTQPNNNFGSENCAVMSFGQHGKWHDWPCTEEKAFICYDSVVSKKVFIRVKLIESQASLDLNQANVTEDILNQLKQKLKDKGVDEDTFQLSWRKQSDGKIFHKERKKKTNISTKHEL
ncbi:mannose-binding protein C-like isoform X2 [Echeneis naucrates]|nr:mannose-binding protein C-like isoform X2 [Echeneis naucrates]